MTTQIFPKGAAVTTIDYAGNIYIQFDSGTAETVTEAEKVTVMLQHDTEITLDEQRLVEYEGQKFALLDSFKLLVKTGNQVRKLTYAGKQYFKYADAEPQVEPQELAYFKDEEQISGVYCSIEPAGVDYNINCDKDSIILDTEGNAFAEAI